MTSTEAVDRLQVILAHLWLVRNFLKHADEIQDDEEMLEIHRTIFDFIRATEPAAQRQDAAEYLHRVRSKLSKLRRAAEHLSTNYQRVSSHTNFEMAALSLRGCVRQIDEILAAAKES